MPFRVLFGLSCMMLPSLVTLVYEAFRQYLTGKPVLLLYVLPALILLISLLAHIQLKTFKSNVESVSFDVIRKEMDDSKYFDQTIRVISLIGIFLASRYFFIDSDLVPSRSGGGQSLSEKIAIMSTVEIVLYSLFVALCARSLAFHANLFYTLFGSQIWKMELAPIIGGARHGGKADARRVSISVTVISDRFDAVGDKETVALREIKAFQIYACLTSDQIKVPNA